ncbi:MAG: hypothetical protein KatS3mg129_2135 [Leptospiraceae bacterium]|nr:MAG: hypothetical protein KatS3mg129_2135 [Leptospiraceae bacterium]
MNMLSYSQFNIMDDIQSSMFFSNPWKKILIENFYNNHNVLIYKITEKEVKSYTGHQIYLYLQVLKRELEKSGIQKYDSIYLESSKNLLSYLSLLLSLTESYVIFMGDSNLKGLQHITPKWLFLSRKTDEAEQHLYQFIKEIQIDDETIYLYYLNNGITSSELQLFYSSSEITKEKEWIGFSKEQILKNLIRYDRFIKSYQYVFSYHPWYMAIGIWMELLISMFKPLRLIFRYQEDYSNSFYLKEFLSQNLVDMIVLYPSMIKDFSRNELKLFKNISFAILTGSVIPFKIIEDLKNTDFRIGYFLLEGGFIFMGEPGEIERNYIGRYFFDNLNIDFYNNNELVLKSDILCKCKIKYNHYCIYHDDFWLNTGDIILQKNDKFYFQGRKRYFISIDFQKWFNPYELEEILKYYFFIENIVILSDRDYKIKIFVDDRLMILQNEIFSIIKKYFNDNHIMNSFEVIFIKDNQFYKNYKGEIDKKYFYRLNSMLKTV